MSLIDSLVIQLKLDAKGFSPEAKKTVQQLKDVEKQANSTGDGIEKSGGKGAAALSSVRREALAMFAVFTAGKGLKQFVGDTTKANAQLDYMSKRLNMDPAALTRMETAAKAAGGSFGEMSQAFSNLQQRMTNPEEAAKIALTFSRLQVPDFTDEAGNIKSDIVERLNKSIHDNKIDPRIATSWLKDLGFGDGAINEALMDPDKFADLQNQIKGIVVPTKAMTEAARHLNQEWVIFSEQSQKIASIFTSKLDPALDGFLQKLIGLEKEYPNTTGALAVVAGGVEELTKSFGGLIGILGSLSALKIIKQLFGGGKSAPAKAGRLANFAEWLASLAEKEGLKLGVEATKKTAGIGARRLLALAGPIGLAAATTAEVMSPTEANGNESKLLEQMRKEGRIGPHATGSPSKDPFFKTYADTVAAKESGGRYDLMGGSGGAYAGKYQMGKGAIQDAANWLREPVPTTEHFLHDPDQQERFFKAYTDANNATLRNLSTSYGKMNSLQRFATLGYAHNQGAGGALDWLKTGNARRDGFGTNAEDYSTAILQAGGVAADKIAQASQDANGPLARLPATTVNYNSPHAEQVKALKQIIADSTPQPQSILRNDHAQVASSVSAGAGPTNNDNSTTNNTSNNNVHMHGNIVVQNNGGSGDDIGRKIQDGLRNQLNARSLLGVQ